MSSRAGLLRAGWRRTAGGQDQRGWACSTRQQPCQHPPERAHSQRRAPDSIGASCWSAHNKGGSPRESEDFWILERTL